MATIFHGPGDVQTDTRKFGIRSYVFRPGGVQQGNVYSSWADLYAAQDGVEARKEVIFDDSVSSPCTIPAGTYAFSDTRFTADWFRAPTAAVHKLVEVTFATGVVITGVQEFEGLRMEIPTTVTTPFTVSTAGTYWIYFRRCVLQGVDPANPMFSLESTGTYNLQFEHECLVGDTAPTVDLFDFPGASTVGLFAYNRSVIDDDCISGDVTSTFAAPELDTTSSIGTTQAGYDGNVTPLTDPVFTSVAVEVSFDDSGLLNISASDVQNAIADLDAAVSATAGDVTGPGAATDHALARFDTTTGKLLQNSVGVLDDAGNLSGLASITLSGNVDGRDVSADGSTLDTHVADATNPHSTSIANVGAGTLAQLNAAVSNATLDDSASSRPPDGVAGGDLGGTYPNPTVDDGADSTAVHDNVAAEISVITEKVTPISGDLLLIEDSVAGNVKKRIQIGNLPIVPDATAVHTDGSGEIAAVPEKVVPVDVDLLLIEDSAASDAKKHIQIGNLPVRPPTRRLVTTTPVTVLTTDQIILVKLDVPGPVAIDLPPIATHEAKMIVIKDRTGDAAQNNITIDANAAETLDGTTTIKINTNFGSVTLTGLGTEWSLI